MRFIHFIQNFIFFLDIRITRGKRGRRRRRRRSWKPAEIVKRTYAEIVAVQAV